VDTRDPKVIVEQFDRLQETIRPRRRHSQSSKPIQRVVQQPATDSRSAQLTEIHEQFDVLGRGYVSENELFALGTGKGATHRSSWNKKKNKALFSHIDDDGNGKINVSEFVSYFGKVLTKDKKIFRKTIAHFKAMAVAAQKPNFKAVTSRCAECKKLWLKATEVNLTKYIDSLDLWIVSHGGVAANALVSHIQTTTNITVQSGGLDDLSFHEQARFSPSPLSRSTPTLLIIGDFTGAIRTMQRQSLLTINTEKITFGTTNKCGLTLPEIVSLGIDPIGIKKQLKFFIQHGPAGKTVVLQYPFTMKSLTGALNALGLSAPDMQPFTMRPRAPTQLVQKEWEMIGKVTQRYSRLEKDLKEQPAFVLAEDVLKNRHFMRMLDGFDCEQSEREWLSEYVNRSDYNKNSKNGEDGPLSTLLPKYGIANNSYFVEVGVRDPLHRSTLLLEETNRYTGVLLPQISEIKPSTINDLLKEHNVAEEFNLLTIQMLDSDYWIWKAISPSYRPSVVLIGYNSKLGDVKDMMVDEHDSKGWTGTDYFGASFQAMRRLGQEKNYTLVYADQKGVNLYFVRSDRINCPGFEMKDVYQPPNYGKHGLGYPPEGDKTRKWINMG